MATGDITCYNTCIIEFGRTGPPGEEHNFFSKKKILHDVLFDEII
jgi:hypothetical protein